jgi:AcrR family transcriptional regulator
MADTTTDKPLNRRQQAKARTRQRVLDAAQGLFAQPGGYEAGTIRQIAKVAGMSTGAVFANFDSKADLYRAIYGHGPIGVADAHRLVRLLVGFLETGGDVFTVERTLAELVPEWRDLPEPGVRPDGVAP